MVLMPLVSRLLFLLIIFFFFSSRRRHTRSKRDWSSDVCSSDLEATMRYDEKADVILNELDQKVTSVAESVQDHISFFVISHCRFKAPVNARKMRSEERRVGKECRSAWSQDH